MPNIPQQQTIVQYVANSAQSQYTFAFYAPLPTDIQVYYQASNAPPIPATDLLLLNTDYTVTYNADPITGGYITLLFTATTGFILTINRQVGASLNTTFANAQTINGANLDAAFDRLLLLCQQNQNYALQRNLSYVINTYLPNSVPYTQLPTLANQQIWQGTASGVIAVTLEQNPDTSTLRSQLANNQPVTNGASIVGYYDPTALNPTNVSDYLNSVGTYLDGIPALISTSEYTFKAGMMNDFAGTVAPIGWLLCDGSAVSRTTYATLFAAIGTTWGVGDGSTTFNLPDFRRAVAIGSGGSGTGIIGNATGNTGGTESHTLGLQDIPEHSHDDPGSQFITDQNAGGPFTGGTSGGKSSTTGLIHSYSGPQTAVSLIQPSAVVTKIIKT
jgi:microcystin-dependent protein